MVWAEDNAVASLARVKAVRSTKAAAKAVISAAAMAWACSRSSAGMDHSANSRLPIATPMAMARQPMTSTQTGLEVSHTIEGTLGSNVRGAPGSSGLAGVPRDGQGRRPRLITASATERRSAL
jgi:hypothetical protein